MILVIGGTTEGRKVVEVLEQGDAEYFYSTRGTMQQIECHQGTHIFGAMNRETMLSFCRAKAIRMIIDAAHPFASLLHATVEEVSREMNIPVIRYERVYPPCPSDAVMCDDYNDAVIKMKEAEVGRLLALTGVQTIARLKGFWENAPTFFRILHRSESIDMAEKCGFPVSNLLFYEEGATADLIRQTGADAIITKESGKSGGLEEKFSSAKECGVKVFIVRRPPIPPSFLEVMGQHGLRRMVERYCPGFFRLRSGFTTGACATAAAKAAAQLLVTDEYESPVKFALPDGEIIDMPIDEAYIADGVATAIVTKDAGDDPDVIHGHQIVVSVAFAAHSGISFIGGNGVGRVTLPGVGLEVGEPAINSVPRQMICHELEQISHRGFDVTISVPDGKALAPRTFNSRIGIEGGISIIGTTGIVMPFSHDAFMDAIRRQIEVAKAIGVERLVINSGAKSERAVRREYPDLPTQAFIHYGNAIGETVRIASDLGITKLTIGIMIGKAVKLAEGQLDTHSHKVVLNRNFICDVARECGCSLDAIKTISNLNMARELWSSLTPDDASLLLPEILRRCHCYCSGLIPSADITAMLIADSGEIPYRIN